jgi:hypothetical protein
MDDNFIYEIPNFVPDDVCDEMTKKFDMEPKKIPGFINQGGKPILDLDLRNSFEIRTPNLENWRNDQMYLDDKLKKALTMYRTELYKLFEKHGENNAYLSQYVFNRPMYHRGFIIQRVEPNSRFRWHADIGPTQAATCMIYLNDIDPKYGGATEFICGRKVQPEKGKLLIFPATWSNVHRGFYVRVPKYFILSTVHFKEPEQLPFYYR